MRLADYPAQEPLSAFAQGYHDEVMRRGEGLPEGVEGAYGPDPYQGWLLYPAAAPDGRVLVFFHGGGWTNGYKEWMAFMAPAFTAAGVTFATVGYRLAPENLFPTAYEDCAAGLLAVRDVVAAHGGDPDRLFAGGHSAGGHHAALLATRRDWWEGRGLPRNPLRGCLPVSGVYRFGTDAGMRVRPRFLGPEGNGAEAAASPLLGRTDAVPFFIAHGDRDFPHLMTQAEEMEAALRAEGTPVERLVLADADHARASTIAGEADGPWVPRALAFMARWADARPGKS